MPGTNSALTPHESGRVMRHTHQLQVQANINANVVGAAWEVRGLASSTPAVNAVSNAAVHFHVQQTGGGTGPRTELFLVGSSDGVNWQAISSISRALSANETFDEFRDIVLLPRFIAVMSRLSGGVLPTHNFRVFLCSAAGVTLAASAVVPNLNQVDTIGAASEPDNTFHKVPCRLATSAGVLLGNYTRVNNVITADANGALTVDGTLVANGDRVLHTTGALNGGGTGPDAVGNGIFDVTHLGTAGTPFILTRSLDADAQGELDAAVAVRIEAGTNNAGKQFVLAGPNPITLNTTAQVWLEGGNANDILTAAVTIPATTASVTVAVAGAKTTDHCLPPNIEVNGATTMLGDLVSCNVTMAGIVTVIFAAAPGAAAARVRVFVKRV